MAMNMNTQNDGKSCVIYFYIIADFEGKSMACAPKKETHDLCQAHKRKRSIEYAGGRILPCAPRNRQARFLIDPARPAFA